MLAQSFKGKHTVDKIVYPVLCTPKLDGIRCLIIGGEAVSRTFKPQPNEHIRNSLRGWPDGIDGLPSGLDGELMIRGEDSFSKTTSGIMSHGGTPDFVYNIFDFCPTDLNKSYEDRMAELEDLILPDFCNKVLPVLISNKEELDAFEGKCLSEGYEGVMIRRILGPYACTRSRDLMKLKRFEDSDAIILEIIELQHNKNEAKKDNFGHTERSTAKEGKVPGGTMGCIRVKDVHSGVEFEIGTGFTQAQRLDIWKTKPVNSIVKYKHQPIGQHEKPRFPVFLGFRHPDDIS